jgi:glycosyltransferase involved in cell wall biosynthesis
VAEEFSQMPEQAIEATLRRHGLLPGYVLFVGSSDPRKNLRGLIEACRHLWLERPDVRLVVAGPAGATPATGAEVETAAGRINWLGYVPDSDLPALYNGAGVFAFPSLYEGFGLPAIEAMRCGTPVMAACRGSLPEVVGNAGVLVDPTDERDMARALAELLQDSALREHYVSEGIRRASDFTWSTTAKQAVRAYKHLAKSCQGPNTECYRR